MAKRTLNGRGKQRREVSHREAWVYEVQLRRVGAEVGTRNCGADDDHIPQLHRHPNHQISTWPRWTLSVVTQEV